MKKLSYLIPIMLAFLAFIACEDEENLQPPYIQTTIDLANKPLDEVKGALKGTWMWHSGWLINECEWHLGDCITTASEQQIDDEDIVSYTFDGDCFLIKRENGQENICTFVWRVPENHFSLFAEDDLMTRTFTFLEIQNDTLTVHTHVYMPDVLSKSELHKLVKQINMNDN